MEVLFSEIVNLVSHTFHQVSSYLINRPKTPVEKALEFFHFDFEFSDEPSDTSLKQNYDVRIGIQLHFLQFIVTFSGFSGISSGQTIS